MFAFVYKLAKYSCKAQSHEFSAQLFPNRSWSRDHSESAVCDCIERLQMIAIGGP